MKKTLLAVAIITTALFTAQSSVTPEIHSQHFGGLQYKADHEFTTLELGIKNVTDDNYALFSEGHTTVMVIYDRTAFFSNTKQNTNGTSKFSVLVGVSLVKEIKDNVGFEYGYYLGGTVEKNVQYVDMLKLGLATMNYGINPTLTFTRMNGASYLGVGVRVLPEKLFKHRK